MSSKMSLEREREIGEQELSTRLIYVIYQPHRDRNQIWCGNIFCELSL